MPRIGHVARRGHLVGIGQAGGVAELGAGHAQLLRLGGHHLGEGFLGAAEPLGHHDSHVVGGLQDDRQDRLLDRDLVAGADAQFRRRLGGGVFGDGELLIEFQPAGLDRFEGEIDRHHLGERGGIPAGMGIDRLQHRAALGIDDDGRVVLGARGWRQHGEGAGDQADQQLARPLSHRL